MVPLLSVAVLRSSFAEPSVQVRGTMWRPWLKFLKGTPWHSYFCLDITHDTVENPHAWEIDAAFELPKATESESDSDSDSDKEDDDSKQQPTAPVVQGGRSPGFADFLQFLELGCGGSPLQGYPAVLAFLHSIPSSVRAQLSHLTVLYHNLNSFPADLTSLRLGHPCWPLLLFILGRHRWSRV